MSGMLGNSNIFKNINNIETTLREHALQLSTIEKQIGNSSVETPTSELNKKLNTNDLFLNVKDFGAHSTTESGYEQFDSTQAIQDAIDYGYSGRARNIYFPSGIYRISSTIRLSVQTYLYGYSREPGDKYGNGSEIQWWGKDGGTAIITSRYSEIPYNGECYQGFIKDLRIINKTATTSGWGIKFRNAQNGAYLKDIHVEGFPTRQVLCEDNEVLSPGDGPGFAHIDNVFLKGGQVPLEIICGTEQFNVTNTGIDTDASSEVGILISPKNDTSATSKWCCKIDSCKVEVQKITSDIPAIKVTVDAPITFINTAVRRNNDINSMQAGILYTNSTRKLPRIEVINCSSWNFGKMFEAKESGVIMKPENRIIGEGFSFKRDSVDMVVPFYHNNVTSNMNNVLCYYTPLTFSNANTPLIMPHRGMVTYVTFIMNALPTSGSISIAPFKNNNYLDIITLTSTNHPTYRDFEKNNLITSKFQFEAGDKITVKLITTSDFSPATNNNIIVGVYFRFY